ncbi:MAG TPA: beta-phosphoglucomutase [Chryseolinea sp.]|nr:beta-phosphoglucomutase [Chryseolinea sp.]
MIKACIFDLDGVIVDTARYHYLAWKRLGKEVGVDLTLEDNERLKGVSRMRSLEIILELAGVSLSELEKERLANKKNTWFVDYIERMAPEEIYPGVKSMIQGMRELGLKLALASSSKNAKTVIQLLHIQNAFDAIVDGTMITHTKPHPEIFLMAAERLGVEPANCVVFEDAEAGIEAAIAAGMKCVGVGSPIMLKDANRIVSTTSEFQIAELNNL